MYVVVQLLYIDGQLSSIDYITCLQRHYLTMEYIHQMLTVLSDIHKDAYLLGPYPGKI